MAKHVLTERAVRTAELTPGTAETTLYDGEGLALRLRASRDDARPPVRLWQFSFVAGGSRRKISVGSWPAVSITAARKKADRYRAMLAAGIAPTPNPTAAPGAAPLAPRTVGELTERWGAEYLANHHKDRGAATLAAYRKHIAPHIAATRLVELKKLHVQAVLGPLVRAGHGRTAAATLALMRQAFRWGMRHDFMDGDPTAALSKAEFAGRRTPRERVLSEEELRDLAGRFASARRAGPEGRERRILALPLPTQAACWVMLGTLARVGEISRARWEHIDFGAGTWVVPRENSKNARAHVIHLSPFAQRHLRHLQQYAAGSPWVLSDRHAEQHLDAKAITKQLRDRQQSDPTKPRRGRSSQRTALMLPGGIFTAHDLRRTGATLMQALGVEGRVIERALNHTESDQLIATYQRAELLPERAAAFARLGARLDELVPEAATAHLRIVSGETP